MARDLPWPTTGLATVSSIWAHRGLARANGDHDAGLTQRDTRSASGLNSPAVEAIRGERHRRIARRSRRLTTRRDAMQGRDVLAARRRHGAADGSYRECPDAPTFAARPRGTRPRAQGPDAPSPAVGPFGRGPPPGRRLARDLLHRERRRRRRPGRAHRGRPRRAGRPSRHLRTRERSAALRLTPAATRGHATLRSSDANCNATPERWCIPPQWAWLQTALRKLHLTASFSSTHRSLLAGRALPPHLRARSAGSPRKSRETRGLRAPPAAAIAWCRHC